MSKLYISIQPRRSGKTISILHKYRQLKKNNQSPIIFCCNMSMKKHMVQLYMDMFKPFYWDEEKEDLERNIHTVSELIHKNIAEILHRKPTNCLIDEYLFFSDRERKAILELYYASFCCALPIEFDVYTTSNKIYKKTQIKFVRKSIEMNRIYGCCVDLDAVKDYISRDEYEELSSNLICQPEAQVDVWYERLRDTMSTEQFRLSIGEFRE